MEKLPEPIKSSMFVSYRARMSGEIQRKIHNQQIGMKTSNICKTKFYRVVWFKIIWFTSFLYSLI